MQNLYKPDLMEVVGVRKHTSDVKSISLRFQDAERAHQFTFRVGQFGIFSAFGAGESTFNICSSSNWRDHIEFCFRKVGRVTEALWQVEEGDTVGFRGPYGRGYRRVKFVFDTSSGTPKILYRQDLTHLGWALGKEARQSALLANATR